VPKIKVIYPLNSTWDELNTKLTKHFRLPHGSRFALSRKSKSAGSRPFVRADTDVRRKRFHRDEHPRDPETRVKDICGKIENMLAPSCRATVVALRPNGEPLDGKTMLKTWREIPGRPTPEERDAAELKRQLVRELQSQASSLLKELEEAVEDPHSDVTDGMMMALMDRYGDASVRDSIRRLRL
jgi:hypothetical protein